jgi:hypothetical protein
LLSLLPIDIEGTKIDCLSFVYVPATSAAHNRLLFFLFLLRPFTVLMKKTHAVKQSIILDVYVIALMLVLNFANGNTHCFSQKSRKTLPVKSALN